MVSSVKHYQLLREMMNPRNVVLFVGLILCSQQLDLVEGYRHRAIGGVGYSTSNIISAYRSGISSISSSLRSQIKSEVVVDESSFRKNVELYDQYGSDGSDKYGSLSDSDTTTSTTDILSTSNSNSNSIYGAEDSTSHDYSDIIVKPPSSPMYSTKYGAKPEVLSPAGGWPQLKAAVANGANACYFGLQEGFNARARASNFGIDELSTVMDYLHERGVKGYLVINILVFDEEMEKLERLVRRVAEAGVDALIMQDLGAVEFVRTIAPNLPVHGSTQMTITDANGARFTKRLGVERVVVGRELSVEEIASVGKGSNVEIEAFVHGALCVSYSGQCFSSEAWGGRSANRGQCAQACRMPYGLIVNGTLVELLDDVKYLLSPQDLMAIDYVPELVVAGVKSFKIEGRLKGPEYVAITTRAYRLAVDEAWRVLHLEGEGNGVGSGAKVRGVEGEDKEAMKRKMNENESIKSLKQKASSSPSPVRFSGLDDELMQDLKQVFSRGQDEQYDGLSAGFLGGVRHQDLVRGRSPRHRGLFVGTVVGKSPKGVVVQLKGPIKRGDGIVLDRGNPEEKEEGGAVYEVLDSRGRPIMKGEEVNSGTVTLSFGRNAVDYSRINPGDIIWRNKDPALDSRMKAYTENGNTQVLDVYVKVQGREGSPLEILLSTTPFGDNLEEELSGENRADEKVDRDESKEKEGKRDIIPYYLREKKRVVGRASTESVLVVATGRPVGRDQLVAAIGTLGDSPFKIYGSEDSLAVTTDLLSPGLFVPVSEVKAARRRAVAALLEATRAHEKDLGLSTVSVLSDLREQAKQLSSSGPKETVGLNKNHKKEEIKGERSVRDMHTVQPAVEGSEDGSDSTKEILSSEGGEGVEEGVIKLKPSSSSRLLNRAKRAKPTPLSLEEAMAIGREVEEGQRVAVRSPLTSTSTPSTSSSSSSSHTASSPSVDIAAAAQAAMDMYEEHSDDEPRAVASELSVLCRTPQQVTAALSLPYIKEITLDFLEVHGLREAVAEIKSKGRVAVVATPRIIKPNEERLYTFYLRLKADALLVRSAGFLNQLLELGGAGAVLPSSNITIPDLRGDFSLNAANAISAGVLLRTGISRLAPTHDLNSQQIVDLVRILGPKGGRKMEVIIHQHLAVFHTEHCVFCRFLSDGSSFKDCGHPCESNSVSLRGFDGQDHLVLADMGCRNTVFSAQAQSGASYLKDFMQAGVTHFRIEFVDEKPEDVVKVINMYRDVCKNIETADNFNMNSNTNSNSDSNANMNTNSKTIADRNIESSLMVLWKYLEVVPNGHGLAQGVSLGSLKPTLERGWDTLRPTAKR